MTGTELWLGIDLGTQGVRVEILDRAGNLVAKGGVVFPASESVGGAMTHDPIRDWADGTMSAIRDAVVQTDPRRIAGVGVCGLFPAIVLLDRAGEPIGEAILHGDTRASSYVAEAGRLLGTTLAGDEVSPRLLWLRATRPAELARADRLVGSGGFVIHALTGRAVIDPQSAFRWGGLTDASRMHWSRDATSAIGLPEDLLPEIVAPTAIAGRVTDRAAAASGLPAGTPVVGGVTDSFATFLGHGNIQAGDTVVYYGSTWTVMSATADLEAVLRNPDLIGDGAPWRLAGYGVDAGRFLGALRTAMFEGKGYDELDFAASVVAPGAGGVVVIPSPVAHFNGRRLVPARGLISGFGVEHGRGEMWRATLESLGHVVAEACDHLVPPIGRVVAAGGGARSAAWRTIVADISGLEQRYHRRGSAALGAAFLAAFGLGSVGDCDPVRAGWLPEQEESITRPNLGLAAFYADQTRAWRTYAKAAAASAGLIGD